MTKQLINADQIERLRASLNDAMPKPRDGYMVRDVVGELVPLLLEMREKGYNLVDIATHFGKQGFAASAKTLGSYLRDHERKGIAAKEKPRRARRGPTKTTPVPVVVDSGQSRSPCTGRSTGRIITASAIGLFGTIATRSGRQGTNRRRTCSESDKLDPEICPCALPSPST